MGQDMVKGRRTEIEFLNGMVARKGDEIGIATPANVVLTDIVKRVEQRRPEARSAAPDRSAAELTGAVAPVRTIGATALLGAAGHLHFLAHPKNSIDDPHRGRVLSRQGG